MKQHFCTILLFLATTVLVHAQRYADLRITAVSPANGTIIANDDSAVVKITLGTAGPDTLLATDTTYLSGSLLALPDTSEQIQVYGFSFPPGAMATLQLPGIGVIRNNRMATSDTTMVLCVRIVTGNLLNPPVHTDLLDTIPANNERCVTITLKGKPVLDIPAAASRQPALAISPNPASDLVAIGVDAPAGIPLTVTLSDISGRKLSSQEYGSARNGRTSVQMDVSRLQPGIYLTMVRAGTQTSTGKLVIRR